MRKFLVLLAVVASLSAAEISVSAAANIGYVFEELKKEFLKDHPNDDIKVVLGSSGKLSSQIRAGAGHAIFMAANMKFANDLHKDGFSKEPAKTYARGVLMMFSHDERDLTKGLDILKDDDIEKISVANTKTAPYGIASKEAFEKYGIYSKIENKLVYAQSISGVMPHVVSGAAGVGFIPKSALIGTEYKENKNYIEVDRALYTPLDQGMILLKGYEDNELAKDFYEFILSDAAKKIFAEYGYE